MSEDVHFGIRNPEDLQIVGLSCSVWLGKSPRESQKS